MPRTKAWMFALLAMVVDFNGKVLDPPQENAVNIVFEFPTAASARPDCPLLSTIDEYGKTVFNGNQCALLLPELALLRRHAETPAIANSIDHLAGLAQRVQGGPHLFLVFLGD